MQVTVSAAGALGGDNCPLNGRFRKATVHTKAITVQSLYEELKEARGYQLGIKNVRFSVDGAIVDAPSATAIAEGMSIFIIGPNRGG